MEDFIMETRTPQPTKLTPSNKQDTKTIEMHTLKDSFFAFSLYQWRPGEYRDNERGTTIQRLSQFCTSSYDITALEGCMEDHLRTISDTGVSEVVPYILVINDDPTVIGFIIAQLSFSFFSECPYPPTVLVVRSESDALKCLPLLEWFTPTAVILDIFLHYRSNIDNKDAVTGSDFSIWEPAQLVSSSTLLQSFENRGYLEAGIRLLCLLMGESWCSPIVVFDLVEPEFIKESLESFLAPDGSKRFAVEITTDPLKQSATLCITDNTTRMPAHTAPIQHIIFTNNPNTSRPPFSVLGDKIEEIFRKT
ncbi:MAG: hypothetical protein RIQ54_331 [Candidatus Parcubacteria bacterium]|jgi:hypothetical protein